MPQYHMGHHLYNWANQKDYVITFFMPKNFAIEHLKFKRRKLTKPAIPKSLLTNTAEPIPVAILTVIGAHISNYLLFLGFNEHIKIIIVHYSIYLNNPISV